MLQRDRPIHFFAAQHNFLTGVQNETAIKTDLVPLRIRAHHRSVTTGRPNRLGRCLEVEGGFIFSQVNGLLAGLNLVDYFFSTCSSNSAIFACEWDLKTLAGR
jgi:hypothetical protein